VEPNLIQGTVLHTCSDIRVAAAMSGGELLRTKVIREVLETEETYV